MPHLSAFIRLSFARPLLLASALLWGAAAQAQLNDTGQTQCDQGDRTMGACSAATTGDTATYKRQDGRFGRDVAGVTKTGGGAGGFDFTRICFNGATEGTNTGANQCTGTLVANTTGIASATPGTDWACTKDNVTNLVWSLETGSGDWTNYASTTLPNATEAAARCGTTSGWRLPTRRELLNIVLNDGSNPSVDASYFPNTQAVQYWTSDTFAPTAGSSWVVDFNDGMTNALTQGFTNNVRLVFGFATIGAALP